METINFDVALYKKKEKKFIEEACVIHKDENEEPLYSYEKTNYIGSTKKLIIICKKHGEFERTPKQHINLLKGCPSCVLDTKELAREDFYKEKTIEFIKQAQEIHKDEEGNPLYLYNKTVCTPSRIVIITCKIHGDFNQYTNSHVKTRDSSGCPTCSNIKVSQKMCMGKDEFVRKAKLKHIDEDNNPIYDYSKVEYVNNKTHVIIICSKHGEFSQTPDGHLVGKKCYQCNMDHIKETKGFTKEDFIKRATEIHQDENGEPLYIYDDVIYVNNATPVSIRCRNGHTFIQPPNRHISGRAGCKMCVNKTELIFYAFLEKEFGPDKFVCEKKFEDCKNRYPLPFDYYSEEYNVVIELDGRQHFEEISVFGDTLVDRQRNDFIKMKYLESKNIALIRISQNDVYKNTFDWKKEIINHIKKYESHKKIYLSKHKDCYEEYKINYSKFLESDN